MLARFPIAISPLMVTLAVLQNFHKTYITRNTCSHLVPNYGSMWQNSRKYNVFLTNFNEIIINEENYDTFLHDASKNTYKKSLTFENCLMVRYKKDNLTFNYTDVYIFFNIMKILLVYWTLVRNWLSLKVDFNIVNNCDQF